MPYGHSYPYSQSRPQTRRDPLQTQPNGRRGPPQTQPKGRREPLQSRPESRTNQPRFDYLYEPRIEPTPPGPRIEPGSTQRLELGSGDYRFNPTQIQPGRKDLTLLQSPETTELPENLKYPRNKSSLIHIVLLITILASM